MTYDEFKKELDRAGLTVREFAELVRMHPAAVTNYAQTGKVQKWIAITVTLMARLAEAGVDFRQPLRNIDISQLAPRGDGGRVVTRESGDPKEEGDERED